MNYKGYLASVRLDEDAGVLHGEISNITDVVTFESETVEGLQQAFHASVEDYLEFCTARGEAPDSPHAQELRIQLSPVLYHHLVTLSGMAGQGLDEFLVSKLDQVVQTEMQRLDYVPESTLSS